MSIAIVEAVPEIANTTRLGARHAEAVLVGSEVSLRSWTGIVCQISLWCSSVGDVVVHVGSHDVFRAVKLHAGSLVVARVDHVGNLLEDIVHPLLPDIPIGFVDGACITTLGATLVWNLTWWNRVVVFGREGRWGRVGEGRGATVVTDLTLFTSKDTVVPVVSVRDVTSVPSKGKTAVGSLVEVLVCTLSVGIAHVVEDSDGELLGVVCGASCGEAQGLGSCGPIAGRDGVVVSGSRLEVLEQDVVEVLAAHGGHGNGTRWSTVIGGGVTCGLGGEIS